MEFEEKVRSGFDLALKYLSYRARTEKEIYDYLIKKNIDERIIAGVMEKLIHYHYVDDRAYVASIIQNNFYSNQYGHIRLWQNLKQKGISRTLLEDMSDEYTDEMETKCIEAQAKRAYERYRKETKIKKRQKITAYLQRRGYTYDMINTALNNLPLDEEVEGQDWQDNQDEDLQRYFQKYYRMQTQKGYSGWELKQRITRNLASRGFSYDKIKDIIDDQI